MSNSNENKLTSPLWRMIANDISIQIIIDIVGIIVYSLLFSLFNLKTALIATSVVFIPIFCYMIYSMYWGTAERENNMVKYGYMQEDSKRGLKAGLIAAIPMFILTIITLVIGLNQGSACNMVGIYKMAAVPFVGLITPLVSRSIWFILPFMFVQLICAVLGYYNGHRMYRIFDHIIYEDGKKSSRKNKGQPKQRR